jgi:hypothetical protein
LTFPDFSHNPRNIKKHRVVRALAPSVGAVW